MATVARATLGIQGQECMYKCVNVLKHVHSHTHAYISIRTLTYRARETEMENAICLVLKQMSTPMNQQICTIVIHIHTYVCTCVCCLFAFCINSSRRHRRICYKFYTFKTLDNGTISYTYTHHHSADRHTHAQINK